MANIKSQIKRNRQNEKRRVRNKAVRSELKTRQKRAVAAAETGAEDADELTRLAIKRIDKAATKGVIHKNQAARRKSRLVKRIAAAEAAAELMPGRPAPAADLDSAGATLRPSRVRARSSDRRRPASAAGASGAAAPGQAGDQHLDHQLRRPGLGPGRSRSASASSAAELGQPVGAEPAGAWASAFLAGKVLPFMPEHVGGRLLAPDGGAVEAEHPPVVARGGWP